MSGSLQEEAGGHTRREMGQQCGTWAAVKGIRQQGVRALGRWMTSQRPALAMLVSVSTTALTFCSPSLLPCPRSDSAVNA